MHISTHMDLDVVALEADDTLSVLIELTAPPAASGGEPRQPSTLQVVLDRSGSMGGDRIAGAKAALTALVDRLDPTDNFGLVAFDNLVEVAVPAGPLRHKDAVRRAIAAIDARGSTDLSGGYLRGLQEAQRVAGPPGATVLLVSDGHANAGVTDPQQLGAVAAEAHTRNVTTSTLGFGLGYDERIMSALARGGAGNELFAEEPDTAVALISAEVTGLLALAAQAASLHIRTTPAVRGVEVLNDLPVAPTADGAIAELGAFYADEVRKVLLVFDVPAIASLGLAEVATLVFTYVELPALTQHTITVPLHVNVVPGDQAAGRVPDPVVRTEVLFQQVQQAKRRASTLWSRGDSASALGEIRAARDHLASAPDASQIGAQLAADLAAERVSLDYLATQAAEGNIARAAKYSSTDASSKSRQRGRPQYDPGPPSTT